LGFSGADLDALERSLSTIQLAVVLRWLCAVFNTFSLLEEVHQGTSRIGEVVRSLKAYSYLDQAPVQEVDIHQGLENTLVMLRSKLKDGITLDRQYDENVPRILAYASELNQVWTNIIDNAIDAMEGKGTITISTRHDGDWVTVDLVDSGPGIPADVRRKLFSPFFTTKPFGKGTGLGLNISLNIIRKHRGEIRVSSVPGNTHFTVRLPVDFQKVGRELKVPALIDQVPDERLAEILRSTRTIAAVGVGNRKGDLAHTVLRYLHDKGYTLIPVCADCDQVLGQDAYSDLLSAPVPVDLVLVCSPAESVLAIVDQAAAIGAGVVWLQEGIIDLDAANRARDSGIELVMDTCIRLTHQRLLGE
jgi:predicted CoA-binding protein